MKSSIATLLAASLLAASPAAAAWNDPNDKGYQGIPPDPVSIRAPMSNSTYEVKQFDSAKIADRL